MSLLLGLGVMACEDERGHPDGDAEFANCSLDVLPGRYPNLLDARDRDVPMVLSCDGALTADEVLSVTLLRDSGRSVAMPEVRPSEVDLDGDGRRELRFVFSRAQLDGRHLIGPQISRLTLALRLRGARRLTAFGRVFVDAQQILALPTPASTVGTRAVELVDATRENPDGRARTLPLRFWYPAEPSAREPAPYFLDEREAAANEDTLHRFDAVHAFAIKNAALRAHAESFPLLVLSTGWGAPLAAYTTQAEALAGEGYVVVGIEHPGGSGSVVLADGTVFPPPQASPDVALADVWAEDIALVARSALDRKTSAGLFAEALDETQVAAFGHSFGGAAAVLAARHAGLLRGAANLDGAFQGAALMSGPAAPVLFMRAEDHGDADPSVETFFAHTRAPAYEAQVAGSAHMNFSDYSFWFTYASQLDPSITSEDLGVGSIAAERIHAITAAYLREFFDNAIFGRSTALLSAQQTRFPEVHVRVR